MSILRNRKKTQNWPARRFCSALAIVAALSVPLISATTSQARPLPRPLPSAPPDPSIKHVVVLYLENQTFDSVLGFWCDQPPQADQNRCLGTGMPPEVPESTPPSGRNTKAFVLPQQMSQVIPEVDHTTGAQQRAMDCQTQNPQTGCKMDGWWRNQGCSPTSPKPYNCIVGMAPASIPNIASLATSYAISTETFSLKNSPSWFGHLYAVAATTDGFSGANPGIGGTNQTNPGWGCDSNRTALWLPTGTQEPSCIPDPSLDTAQFPYGGAFAPSPVPWVPTIMDRLDQQGLSWRIYGAPQPDPQGTAPFSVYNGGYLWDVCPSFADCLYTQQHQNNNVSATTFTQDAQQGNLPAFSLITPGDQDVFSSCHNGFTITNCDNWVGSIAQSILSGPEASSTVLFVTWDDCGCFYDQQAPPAGLNADGEPPGPRSPLLIIGDDVKQGFTDTTPTTFAGILAFTEHTFGLAPLGANDAAAYDFANAFTTTPNPTRFRATVRNVPKGTVIDRSQSAQDS